MSSKAIDLRCRVAEQPFVGWEQDTNILVLLQGDLQTLHLVGASVGAASKASGNAIDGMAFVQLGFQKLDTLIDAIKDSCIVSERCLFTVSLFRLVLTSEVELWA